MSKGGTALGIAILAVVLLVVGAGIYGSMGLGQQRAESQYTGHVVDVVEDKGYILTPTWVNMKTDPRSSDQQSYCIKPEDQDELLPKFYAAMESGDRYTVTYERPLWVSPNHCKDGDAIITGIEKVNNSSQ